MGLSDHLTCLLRNLNAGQEATVRTIFGATLGYYSRFPGSSDGKEIACKAGDPGSIPGSGRSPAEGKWQPTPVSLPGKSHGQRRMLGYSPWGGKE